MSKPNYRVILSYDAERKVFHGRAPELEHCTGEGTTRSEAITRVEEEIDAQLANMLSHGSTPPRSVDEETYSGQLTAKVSVSLHRDLTYQARTEGLELDQLLGELLAAALEGRKQTHRGQRGGNRQAPDHVPHDGIGNRHEAPRRPAGFGGRGGYNPAMDDRANFIEYVRGLEQGGGNNRGPAHGGHGGHSNQGGHAGHGPGAGGPGRGRRRGGGGGGRGPGQGNGQRFDNNRDGRGNPGGGHGGPPRDGQPHNGSAVPARPAPGVAPAPQGGSGDDGAGNA